ncbi:MAG: 4Fe-4S dicluster domain-containing protein [Candidatus Sumerlaeia bacterium]|nr:4Fe-4S dicluster domain-containing protein [Candidatus Sumerlaeia bacterium]
MKVIKKDKLKDLLQDMMQQYDVFAEKEKHSKIQLDKINNSSEIVFSSGNTHNKPTALFFPQCETLFKFDTKSNYVSSPPLPEKPMLIFGIRPCDARSLLILDKVFSWDGVEDQYYFRRRNNALLLVTGCNEPRSTCFCNNVGGGPMDTAGADLFLTELPEVYVIEPVTSKGRDFLQKIESYLDDCTPAELKLLAEIRKNAESMLLPAIEVKDLPQKLHRNFEHPIWEEFHSACVGCGTCAYLCPTCHCFDIVDIKKGHRGERIRCWDCCMYPIFTLHASGHNPRPGQKERVRQRIMHKFEYFVDNFGEIACVGCGRCIINCPVNIDIRYILKTLNKVLV